MNELSPSERVLLGAIEHRAEESLGAISKLVGFREYKVRYLLASLSNRGVISGRRAFLNLYPLGFTDFTLFFTLRLQSSREREGILARLKSHRSIFWMASLAGEYQYGAAIFSHSVADVASLFTGLSSGATPSLEHKSLSARVRLISFGRKYLNPKLKSEVLTFERLKRPITLDQVDQKIVDNLRHYDFSSYRDVSRQTSLSIQSYLKRQSSLTDLTILLSSEQ